MNLVKVSYEQSRLEFFQEQLKSAERKMKWAVNNTTDQDWLSMRGEQVSFYEWAVEMAGKEVAKDGN